MSRRFLFLAFPLLAAVAAVGAAWTLMAREHPPGDPADEEQVAVGGALYGWNCARCHGEDLGGELGWVAEETNLSDEQVRDVAERLGDVAPAHDDKGQTSRLDDATLFRVIDEGPATVLDKPNSRMSGFHGHLSDGEIWAIIAFMKSHWVEGETPPD
ncbi:MAG: c-type cytochrome [Alphaproteobacteria bacterium]|nr:c-type cytochrome [Alphaproteobacteria bacterium]